VKLFSYGFNDHAARHVMSLNYRIPNNIAAVARNVRK